MWWPFNMKLHRNTESPKRFDSFVKATGGGWGEAPDVVDVSSDSQHSDYVDKLLEAAQL